MENSEESNCYNFAMDEPMRWGMSSSGCIVSFMMSCEFITAERLENKKQKSEGH
jgi:hypothetical protein